MHLVYDLSTVCASHSASTTPRPSRAPTRTIVVALCSSSSPPDPIVLYLVYCATVPAVPVSLDGTTLRSWMEIMLALKAGRNWVEMRVVNSAAVRGEPLMLPVSAGPSRISERRGGGDRGTEEGGGRGGGGEEEEGKERKLLDLCIRAELVQARCGDTVVGLEQESGKERVDKVCDGGAGHDECLHE